MGVSPTKTKQHSLRVNITPPKEKITTCQYAQVTVTTTYLIRHLEQLQDNLVSLHVSEEPLFVSTVISLAQLDQL